MKIVTEMVKIQKQRGLTNSEFAKSLEIHTISWYRNKRTQVIDAEILLRAFEVYPELKGRFFNFDTDPTEAHYNAWERALKFFRDRF